MAEMIDADWLSLSETAELLGVHPATVRSWADRGELPVRRTAGGHRRFRRADVEARAVAADRSQQTGAQLVIENMLGRARFQLTEGALSDEGWYGQLDEQVKDEHRLIGRQLLNLFVSYLAHETLDESLLEEARNIGARYEEMGRQSHMSFVDTTRAYLVFRQYLSQTVYDLAVAAGMQGPTDWGQMHHRIAELSNEVLLAMIEAHESDLTL